VDEIVLKTVYMGIDNGSWEGRRVFREGREHEFNPNYHGRAKLCTMFF
jgi:hypothetical protein